MITAVDANILIDLGAEDAGRAGLAAQTLEACASAGRLVVCEVVVAEIAAGFPVELDPVGWVKGLGIDYDPIREEAAVHAGRMQAKYEARTGRRTRRPIADLLIGAHALIQADRFVTRDRGFYRDYFQALKLVEPR